MQCRECAWPGHRAEGSAVARAAATDKWASAGAGTWHAICLCRWGCTWSAACGTELASSSASAEKPKLSPTNTRALTRMKQTLRKHNAAFVEQMQIFRQVRVQRLHRLPTQVCVLACSNRFCVGRTFSCADDLTPPPPPPPPARRRCHRRRHHHKHKHTPTHTTHTPPPTHPPTPRAGRTRCTRQRRRRHQAPARASAAVRVLKLWQEPLLALFLLAFAGT